MNEPDKIDFLGLDLFGGTTEDLLEWIVERGHRRDPGGTIGYLNASTFNLAYENETFAEALKDFDLLYADGKSIVWASRFLRRPVKERINAGDFTEDFLLACADNKLKIGLIGGTDGDAEGFAKNYRERISGLDIVLVRDGYFSDEETEAVDAQIEEADPDILLIGMGSPRQENFALRHMKTGKPRLLWCVGALFEYDSGRRWRAPVWIRKIGMEWLFRLCLEPGRLWKRYLIGNPKFAWRVWRRKPIAQSSANSGSAGA